jgi:hypothetical protein
MNDYETRERILSEALEEIKQKVGSELNSIMGNLYSDYLPHVVGDTDANISYRVEGCIKNILQGKIQLVEGHPTVFYVNDQYGSDHHISLSHYFDWKPLCDSMGETIQTNRIKQLEQEVESLKTQLKSAYEYRNY